MLNNTQLLRLDGITKLYVDDRIPEENFQFIHKLEDLPTPVSGVINFEPHKTYFFIDEVDLLGNRIVCGSNTTILGASSENCRIKSTGLTGALISSTYSLPIRGITLEANLALDLNGDGVTTALDWFGVNFTNCPVVGTIKNYSNVIWQDSAFLNSGGCVFDGTIGTIGLSQCLFDNYPGTTAISLPPTAVVSRRFRTIYSSFITGSGETSINVSASASIPTESYILDTVSFGGGGTYLNGLDSTSNTSLFINCKGVTNSAVNGQVYMIGNTTPTTIALSNTFYKILGTTSNSLDNSKYTGTNNRLTCNASISRKYLIQCSLSFNSGTNNICEFGFYDSVLGTVRTPSRTKSTANASGRAENISLSCIVSHSIGNYLEIWCNNNTGVSSITVTDMNFIVTEIK